MAIKWGSTWVTAVKWGNTVCTQVKWGSTVVFPTGGYDGSSFSYPFNTGIKVGLQDNTDGATTQWSSTFTSGNPTYSMQIGNRSSTQYWCFGFIESASQSIDFTKYTKINIAWSLSLPNNIFKLSQVYLKMPNGSTDVYITKYNRFQGEIDISDTSKFPKGTGKLQIQYNISKNSKYGNVTATLTLTKLIFS